jgi:hypothetical protein
MYEGDLMQVYKYEGPYKCVFYDGTNVEEIERNLEVSVSEKWNDGRLVFKFSNNMESHYDILEVGDYIVHQYQYGGWIFLNAEDFLNSYRIFE